jgi:ferredoxin
MSRRIDHFVLKVDPILCDGFGHCHELAPELVHVDEWGYPIINEQPTSSSDVALLKSAKLAVRGCPRQALRIERISGPT